MPFKLVGAVSWSRRLLSSCNLCLTNALAILASFFPDVASPKFFPCPKNIFVTAAREKESSKVEWDMPDVIDNSGIPPNVTLHGKHSGTIFDPGDHVIRYSATDKRGNLAECTFKVVVSGNFRRRVR